MIPPPVPQHSICQRLQSIPGKLEPLGVTRATLFHRPRAIHPASSAMLRRVELADAIRQPKNAHHHRIEKLSTEIPER